jgi:3-hydroxybutyryl-CoA dehydrogenase
MTIEEVNNITIVGSGAMGSQISMVCALSGYEVVLHDVQQESLDKAKDTLEELMRKRVAKGRLSEEEVKAAFDRLSFSSSLADAVKNADFVIEAIVEKLETKQNLFQEMDQLAPAHAIFATNSSTIVSSKMAHVTQRPERVCNMHFFNPALVMELVEIVKGPHTSERTASIAYELAKSLSKTPILMEKEIFGFVANRILTAIFDEAMYLYENGYASFEEIDIACTKGLNHPIGPFALLDLTGIDVNYHIKTLLFGETKDEKDAPSKSLQELYERGDLGRKTGKGFYAYS